MIDTHALLWHLSGDRRRLSARALRTLKSAEERVEAAILVPAVVMAEAMTAIERRKVKLTIDALFEAIEASAYRIVPLYIHVIQTMRELPNRLELHDRMIAATARYYGAKLISRDPEIGAVIDVIW